jgi:hypothetical protein
MIASCPGPVETDVLPRSHAALTVDSENRTGAPALYERVGMRSVQVSHTHVKELRPGVNLVPQ